jgi:uncharacterized protein (DUF362 family)
MNRREFCRRLAIAGGSVALTPLLNACKPIGPLKQANSTSSTRAISDHIKDKSTIAAEAEPVSTLASDVASGAMRIDDSLVTKIVLVKTNDRSEGIHEAIRLLELGDMRGDRVLLKPNFNSADESPGSTHIDTLSTLVGELNELGAGSITVGDRSGMGSTRAVMQQKGLDQLASDLGFELAVFDELEDEEWTMIRSGDFHWKDGFAVPKMLLDAAKVVQTCNLKTHQYGGHFTMALKNSVGLAARKVGNQGTDYMSELHGSPYQRLMIAEINSAYKPDLIVMDGIEAFVSGGPANGRKVSSEVIVAGTDPVAIDAVGVAILRLFGTTPEVSKGRVFDQEQIARAAELGLGVTSPDQIQLVTTGEGSEVFGSQISSILTS